MAIVFAKKMGYSNSTSFISMLSNLPSPEEITSILSKQLTPFTRMNWVAQTGSTNADLMSNHDLSMGQSQLLGAHLQTTGRGRAGRVWHNTAGQSLTFSCGFETNLKATELNGLSLALGVGACESIRKLCPGENIEQLKLKWPNDLMFHHGKLAGILVETQINTQRIRVIVGIGINLIHAKQLSNTIGREVSALNDFMTLKPEGVVTLINKIATTWHNIIFNYANNNLLTFEQRFKHLDYLLNQPVTVTQNQSTLFEGIAQGINSQGALLVHNGLKTRAVTVGDISVRVTSITASTSASP
jgi:BirA family transcriptional regulator, biotin operon repressor / biotin---[acetyl-CoA-carboxylase] ligase